jgi:replicative DNA helicase
LIVVPKSAGKNGREQEVSYIGEILKKLAMELGIVVVALSQMNAEMFDRTTLRPEVRDLRESKALEAHADCIILLWRPEKHGLSVFPEKKDKNGWTGPNCVGKARAIVGKLRNGKDGGVAEFRWYGEYQLFADHFDAIEIDKEKNHG